MSVLNGSVPLSIGRCAWLSVSTVVLVVSLIGAGGCATQGQAQDGPGTLHAVERVVDGDTVILAGIGRVRLIGVDTPETVDPRRPVERFGTEASDFLKTLLSGRRVRVEYDQTRTDRYDRTLAYLYLPDGTFVNEEIIGRGYGFAYTRFPFKYLEQFRERERQARDAGVGLWKAP